MKKIKWYIVMLISLSVLATACSSDTKKEKVKEKIRETVATVEEKQAEVKPESELYPAYMMEGTKKKWGYINEEGNFVIKAEFDNASDFKQNGLAVVRINEKDGIIDRNGKFVVEPDFTYISDFYGKVAVASKGWPQSCLLDEKGKVLFETEGSINEFRSGLAAFSRKADKDRDLWGYINDEGKVVVEPKYEYAHLFMKDKALVKKIDGKFAVIDKTGNELKEIQNDRVTGFSEDTLVFVRSGNSGGHKYGYMSINGDVTIEPAFSDAREFEDGLAVVNAAEDFSSKYGVINKKGEFVIAAKYPSITSLGSGLFAVPEIQEYTFNDTFLRKALFDKSGKQLTDFKYYDLAVLENGLISANDDTDTFLLDEKGNEVKSIQRIQGVGSIKPAGKLYKVEADNNLYYYTPDGKQVWKSDSTITLEGGLKIERRAFRPDRCMLIEYPEISELTDSAVQEAINRKLKEEFVGSYKGSNKEGGVFTEVIDIGYGAERNKELLIISKSGYFYPIGAAHGQPYREELHINIKTGKLFEIKDLFKKGSGYGEKLTRKLKEKIVKMNNEEGVHIFSDDVGDWEESSGFTVKKDELKIYFHPYAIAPYAAGFPEFDIPYEEIMSLIDIEGEFWRSFDREKSKENEKNKKVHPNERIKIEETIKGYENAIIEAINKNDFKLVEPWLYPDSSLYNSQNKLVADLNRKKIKERLESYSIEDIRVNDMETVYRVYVTENIAIQYPGQDYATKQFKWVYSAKYDYEKKRYLLTYIDKWENK